MAIPQSTPAASRPKGNAHSHRPQAQAGLEGQALALGPGRRRRLARPGLHLQAQAQAAEAPLPRPRPEAGPARAAPAAPFNPDPRPAGAYQGPFGVAEATRLLDRAGFGPTPGQAQQLASMGLLGAVQSLTRPSGAATLHGPAPVDDDGNPIAPADTWGHDHLWWLDRMVRSDQPLVERMALVFHDWFATSLANVSKQQQMIDQSNLFRAALLRLLPRPLQGGHRRPGDAAVAERQRKQQVRAERELRPGDDGAVLPRRRPRRLHRGRHPRTGAGADRVAQRVVGIARRPQLPLRPRPARRQKRRRSSARPATGAGKTPAGSASRTRSTPPSSSTSCGATSSPSRRRRRCGKA